MPASVRVALSGLVHTLIGVLISVGAAHGIDIPAHWSAVAEGVGIAAVVAGYTWLTHWLAGREGDSLWARGARLAARVLTLGTGALQLAKATPAAARYLGAKP